MTNTRGGRWCRAEVDRKALSIAWLVPKLPGGAEVLLRAKMVRASFLLELFTWS